MYLRVLEGMAGRKVVIRTFDIEQTKTRLVFLLKNRKTRHSECEVFVWGFCGSLAANIDFTELFLRMGVDELSVPPSAVLKIAVLKIRENVRNIRLL